MTSIKLRYTALMDWRAQQGIKERPPKTNERSEKEARAFELNLISMPLHRKRSLFFERIESKPNHRKKINDGNNKKIN